MVPDEDVQIVTVSNKRSRCQKIDFPVDGSFKITVHVIGINQNQEYTKCQRSTQHILEYASSILSDINDNDPSQNVLPPTIRAEELHKIVINFFAQNAGASINEIILMGQQKGLIGDGQADFNYCTSGPLFLLQKKRVTLITDPSQEIPVNATSYGVRTSSPSLYSPWSIDVGLLKIYGKPMFLPSIYLGLQVKLSEVLSDPDEVEITCRTLFDFGDSDIISLIKDSDGHSPGTAVSIGQFAFYSRPSVWGVTKIPILVYLGKPAVKGISSKAAEGYRVTNKNQKVLMSNSAALDTARGTNVQRCIQRKNAITAVLVNLDPTCFTRLFNFQEFECPFESMKVLPNSKKFIETMTIIFSGSHKDGKQIFPDKFMPFEITDDYSEGVSARTKDDWESFFPSALIMHRNVSIEKSHLEGIFSKKKSKTSVHPSSSDWQSYPEESNGESSNSVSSSRINSFPPEYAIEGDDFDLTTDFLENYYTRTSHAVSAPSSDTAPDIAGPKSEYNSAYGLSRGIALVESVCGTREEVDFNVDLTVIEPRKLGGKIGTHKWKLSLNYLRGGETLFSAGTYLSVTSIDENRRVVFASPLQEDMHRVPHKCYSIGLRYFVMPSEACGTPESLYSDV